ncbi:tail fiber domain-containing protein [Pseudomonas fluorescens]|uniref:tail fiber domain-containing protein n=1 Tax=Pseudomonas fluorescens TaxID=294 RepID=UPI001ADEA543|nr:tail fiber domain-containing protein [Pseudomonas fluorescens]
MPWLRGGTVAVTNGSTTVIGTNADFAANSRIGDAFIGPDGSSYEIGNVASAAVISIIPAYKGPTASGVAYAIMPVHGYPKALADSFNSINRQWGSKLEALGTTGNYDTLPPGKGGTGITDLSVFIQGMLNDADDAAARATLGAAKSGANNDITALTALTAAIPVSMGGTGGKTQPDARAGLGLGSSSVKNTGTSGDSVPLLNAANTWSAPQVMSNGTVVGATGVVPGSAVFQVISSQGRIILTQGTGLNSIQSVNAANSGYLPLNVVCTNFYNDIDNSANLGNGSKRWATVFAASGTINTSDAREKTAVAEMSQAEINTAMALAKEIGVYRWLDAVANKGDEARLHIGLTVQRVIEVMESFGLEPLKYAFVCHDEWPAIEEQGYESIKGNIYSLGERIYTDVEISMFDQYREYPATFTWEETSREYVVTQKSVPAGDRYGFRYDQLALFIARGQEERIARLEALISPIE